MDTWKAQLRLLGPQFESEYNDFTLGNGLNDLLKREWFFRVWVIQEAALAKTAVITCGHNTVNSRAFVVMPELLYISCNESAQSRLDIMPGLLRQGSWRYEPEFQDLGMLLQKFGRSKATDPRDIIYSLFGLCRDRSVSPDVRPDYDIPLQEVIQRTVAYLLSRSREVDGYLGNYNDMPTWDMEEFLDALEDLPFEVYEWLRCHRKAGLPNLRSSLTSIRERDYLIS